MIEKVLRVIFLFLFMVLGVVLANQAEPILATFLTTSFWQNSFLGVTLLTLSATLIGCLLGFFVGIVLSPFLLKQLAAFAGWGERMLGAISLSDLALGVSGLFIGLLIANLVGLAFANLPLVGPYIPIVLSIILGYTGMHLAVSQKTELGKLVGNLRWGREREAHPNGESHYGKILDTSVIIDGRIADIARTGFLEGPLVVAVFVLEELQYIADSADVLKRNRGRRGLDILNQMRKKKIVEIKIVADDFDDTTEVDSKLIHLALAHGAPIVTNDYNLNKVAELQGVQVLNINDLANAVKPVVIPGEQMYVQVVKQGKEEGQGVAYLEDGTMVVVENGSKKVGKELFVIVTSVLQTSAGKMIFARYEGD